MEIQPIIQDIAYGFFSVAVWLVVGGCAALFGVYCGIKLACKAGREFTEPQSLPLHQFLPICLPLLCMIINLGGIAVLCLQGCSLENQLKIMGRLNVVIFTGVLCLTFFLYPKKHPDQMSKTVTIDSLNHKFPMKQSLQPLLEEEALKSQLEEEKEQERARLQTLMKSFAKQAVQGITCTLVADSGALRPAKYFIDQRLEKLSMKVTDVDPPDLSFTCPLAQIKEISRPGKDGGYIFPKDVDVALNNDQKERLLMISYTGERSSSQRCFFLGYNTSDSEQFIMCMKILQLSYTATPARCARASDGTS